MTSTQVSSSWFRFLSFLCSLIYFFVAVFKVQQNLSLSSEIIGTLIPTIDFHTSLSLSLSLYQILPLPNQPPPKIQIQIHQSINHGRNIISRPARPLTSSSYPRHPITKSSSSSSSSISKLNIIITTSVLRLRRRSRWQQQQRR